MFCSLICSAAATGVRKLNTAQFDPSLTSGRRLCGHLLGRQPVP